MKEQLESVVLQMYRAGVRCSAAVREFQRAFILTVLQDQRGNQCRAAEKHTGIRCAERSEIWRLTSALHEQRGGVDHRGRSFQCRRCVDVQRSNTLTAYLDLVISYSRLPEISCRVVAVRCGLVPD
jgi:hypothetical protein